MVDNTETLRKHLQIMYWDEGKSLWKISEELQIPYTTLWLIFEDCGIRTRTIKKAMKLWHKQRKK